MYLQDDRTAEQKRTHSVIVMGTDPFISDWVGGNGGTFFAGWACTPDTYRDCLAWVEGRKDMKRVRVVGGDYKPKGGPGHVHIYVWRGRQ